MAKENVPLARATVSVLIVTMPSTLLAVGK